MSVSQHVNDRKNHFIFKEYLDSKNKLDFIEPQTFGKKNISVFAHYLNIDEAANIINPYPVFMDKIDENETLEISGICKEYYNNESKFILFYIYLYKNFDLLFYNDDKRTFYKIKKIEDYINVCEQSIREKKFTDLYIPEAQCVISGSFDFTIVLYYQELKKCFDIITYAKKAQLNILD